MADKKGSRIVVCSRHGIPYDASERGGCARCIREWERQKKAGQARGGVPTAVKLLGLLLVAAAVYLYLNRPQGAAEPAAAAPPAPAAAAPADAGADASAALNELATELVDLIRAGRSEAEVHLTDTSDAERRRESWEFWSFDWSAKVERLAVRLPAAPSPQADPKQALVHQQLGRVVSELRAIPRATNDGVPDPARVARHFEDAERALQQARLHLARR